MSKLEEILEKVQSKSYLEKTLVRAQIETEDEYMKWAEEIPYLTFPTDWEIQPIPPFVGAIVRFRARLKGGTDSVSVYLDCYDRIGYFGAPYWEAYPIEGDNFRCAMKDTDELVKNIDQELRK